MYNALWGKSLDQILRKTTTGPAGMSLQYMPKDSVVQLNLLLLNYQEDVLLIRKEYITAFDALVSRSTGQERGGGVVVLGQPGIGV